ncbi:ABC transporter ATP-binding protein/permease [Escherichia coli]|uniref:ABC transporter ATP-binding protein/permease n=1 Tax=Escherichia coli TaxID=562 RepID=A0A3S4K4M9_ECOLX|nr:ABC transporter ATP-binding protein/permease [Escherichia coli]
MRLFAQLSWYFRREWRRYLGAVALLVIIAMLQLVPPKVVGIVVDGVTEQHFTTGQILMWIATMVLIAVVVYLCVTSGAYCCLVRLINWLLNCVKIITVS